MMSLSFYILTSSLGVIAGAVGASALHALAMRSSWSWMRERSRCESCGTTLRAMNLIPVVSYLKQRGRSSCCDASIIPVHLWIELIGAVAGGYIGWRAMDLEPARLAFEIVVLLLVLFTIALDQRKQLISLPALALASTVFLAFGASQGDVQLRVAGAVFGTAFFALQWVLTHGRGIGTGDIWLGGAMGLAVGHVLVLPTILLGYMIGSIQALYLLATKKATRKTRLPLGVYLSLGLLVTVLFESQIWRFLGVW